LNNTLTIPRIINYASLLANRDICVSAGYSLAECGTYYGNQGTWITMHTTTTSATTLFDPFPPLQTIVDSSPANAPLIRIDLGNPGANFWAPAQTYGYSLAPVDTQAARDALKAQITGNAGAGRL
ncbi:MAG TPA: hypothetical protein VNH63_10165, partial [Gemmatimonadales bacterium]|nr:hypothetical protein [Gemmatimonadales bacterium]